VTDDAHYLIPAAMLHGLLAYLGRRPYGEVAAAMRALEALQLAPGSVPDPEPAPGFATEPEDL
jgi:hypothetical protein